MENQFKMDGYTFKEIKSTNPHRPYRVRCIETGDEKDGAISYQEAAGLLVGQYEVAKNMWEITAKMKIMLREFFRMHCLEEKSLNVMRL